MENIILFDRYDQVYSGLKLTPDQIKLLHYLDNKGLLKDDVEVTYDNDIDFFKEV